MATKKDNKAGNRNINRQKTDNPGRNLDPLGIFVMALAVAVAVGLCTHQKVTSFIPTLFGAGSFFVPVVIFCVGLRLIFLRRNLFSANLIWGSVIACISFVTMCSSFNLEWGGLFGKSINYALGLVKLSPLMITVISLGGLIAGVWMAMSSRLEDVYEANKDKFKIRKGNSENRRKAVQNSTRMHKKSDDLPDFLNDEKKPKPEKEPKFSLFGKKKEEKPENSDIIESIPISMTKIRPTAPKKPQKPLIEEEIPEPVEGIFTLPPTSLLAPPVPMPEQAKSEVAERERIIKNTLAEFGIDTNILNFAQGPTFTRYEIDLPKGIKVQAITSLADNIALRLSAYSVRVEAPIPGKAAIGIEVPNQTRGTVVMRDILESSMCKNASKLSFVLGRDVENHAKLADLTKMPHLLVGGTTNSGKSICLSAIIMSILYRCTPDEVKLILIDPKRVELSLFEGIPHLAAPVIKDVRQAASVLRAVVVEMEKRYDTLSKSAARNIKTYNEKVEEKDRMPYMVVIVDELADLMIQCAAEVEASITRIAQLARAVGIHLILATQRPSSDVITGVIKSNISSRIAFSVASGIDSRIILDQRGAQKLLGMGDMLFMPIDASKPMRIQGCYVSEDEIEKTCEFLKKQRKPVYTIIPGQAPAGSVSGGGGEEPEDEHFEAAVYMVVNTGYCSTSMIQRKFKIGYTRAARMVDEMEMQGIVGPQEGAKPREVLMSREQVQALFAGIKPTGEDVSKYYENPTGETEDEEDWEDESNMPHGEIIGGPEPDRKTDEPSEYPEDNMDENLKEITDNVFGDYDGEDKSYYD
ncbi:MAG: DNA translocase FtsK [Abditibacteriota bacterium]|nr:DNA translocase FtsK [Abditibacteriota bacterium]